MNIISWNLLKISSGHSHHAQDIANEFLFLRADPFVFFVLESTGDVADARSLGHALADAMGHLDTRPTVQAINLGGSRSRMENVICLSRGVDHPHLELLDSWRAPWNQQAGDLQAHRLQVERDRAANSRYPQANRRVVSGGTDYSTKGYSAWMAGDPPPTDMELRAPAVFTCRERSGRSWKIVVVHAPGPSDGLHRGRSNAAMYFEAVAKHLPPDTDVLIGDFNQYQEVEVPDAYREVSGIGNTTHGDTRVSRLDRIFVRRGVYGSAVKFAQDDRGLSDHMGIALKNAGAHPHPSHTMADITDTPIVGVGCSTCRMIHGGMRGIINKWHICQSCNVVYCPACGRNLPRVDPSSWQRFRRCTCGGQTVLVS